MPPAGRADATATTTPDDLRRRTTARVLRSLRDDGPAGRARLAEVTGLSKATTGTIAARLADLGLIDEADADPGTPGAGGSGGSVGATRGRPVRPVALRPGVLVGLGMELNVDYVAVAAVDLAGGVARHAVRAAGPDDRVGALVGLLAEVREALGEVRTAGAVLAVPGLVEADRVTWAPNLRTTGEEVAARLRGLLGEAVPLHLDNDASCAAWGEVRHGAARGARHALYLTGTVGLGAGIVADGQVLRGAAGNAGEVGHVPLGHPGAPCGCGRTGCWETAVGLGAMLAATGQPERGTPVATAEAVAARATVDPGVREGVRRVAEDLARGLAVVASVVDPEVVVLGGYLGALGAHLLDPATEALDRLLPSPSQRRPDLVAGRLGIDAAAVGAAELALDPVLLGDVDPP
ncbi:ROK family transcriptional regulator [Nocardioides lentus]|uniref:ROK family transcriptional regulator n=1 Tax=Nocardioides lentus TaxID=338077 RepID=A0ABN2PN23_9ACTN